MDNPIVDQVTSEVLLALATSVQRLKICGYLGENKYPKIVRILKNQVKNTETLDEIAFMSNETGFAPSFNGAGHTDYVCYCSVLADQGKTEELIKNAAYTLARNAAFSHSSELQQVMWETLEKALITRWQAMLI